MMTRYLHAASIVALLLLIALCLAWELFLAPLRPGGSWLVLKALPLLLPLRGLLRGNRYTCQWASLLVLAYFVEGVVRTFSETPPSQFLAHPRRTGRSYAWLMVIKSYTADLKQDH